MKLQTTKMRGSALMLGGLMILAASGCGGGSGGIITNDVTTYGSDSTFGAGKIRSYITMRGSVPVEVGMEVSEAALAAPASLPQPPTGQAAVEVPMAQPAVQTSATPFLSTTMFYSPGHPPDSQEVPHLHPTWFVVSDAVRGQILPNNSASFVPPVAGELPTGFITPPDLTAAYIPTIGNIYFDPTEAGYNENPFTTALSEYRYFDGHISAIALGTPNSYLISKATLTRPIGVPAKYPKAGYYPTTYTLRYNSARKTYVMALGGFVQRS